MDQLDDKLIRRALSTLGRHLNVDHDVEILIVGGAAGILTGAFPPEVTTMDADAIWYRPPKDRELILETAAEISRELSLPTDWLNEWSGLYAWSLPDGWESRRVLVGKFDHLHVYAASRIDLIVMKFIAHRGRDRDHLNQLKVTPQELAIVRGHLDSMGTQYPRSRFPAQAGAIEMAQRYVDAWQAE
jgi:nucleotide-binding universal stress UspA family protein